MTCRELKGGSAAASLARQASGLTDAQIVELLHKAKGYARERGAQPPTSAEVNAWVDTQTDRVVSNRRLSDANQESLLTRLAVARKETPDGPTFASWRAVDSAAEAVTWDIPALTAAKQAVRRLRPTEADAAASEVARVAAAEAEEAARPVGRDRPPRLLAVPVPPRSGDEYDAEPYPFDQQALEQIQGEVRAPVGIESKDGSWTTWGPAFYDMSRPVTQSGWKLHVASASGPQTIDAMNRLQGVCTERGLGWKVATANHVEKYTGTPGRDRQRTKGVTVYLPRRDTADADVTAVVAALDGYQTDAVVTGTGEHRVAGAVYARWEFGGRNPERDVTTREARDLYTPAVD